MEDTFYARNKISDLAGVLRKMSELYEEGEAGAFGVQFGDIAEVLEHNSIQAENLPVSEKKFVNIMKKNNVFVEAFCVKRRNNGVCELCMRARSFRKGSVKVVTVSRVLSELFGRDICATPGNRSVITTYPVELVFADAPDYFTLFGMASLSGMNNSVSGDNFSYLENVDGKAYLTLADGMGMGVPANNQSRRVIELFEQYIQAGVSAETALRSINTAYSFREKDELVAMDCIEMDLYSGYIRLLKQGGTSSFVKTREIVTQIVPSSLPLGMLYQAKPDISSANAGDGEYIILLSDGVIDALPFFDKEKEMMKIINDISAMNPNMLAKKIMKETLFFTDGEKRDDMTVLVMGIWRCEKKY